MQLNGGSQRYSVAQHHNHFYFYFYSPTNLISPLSRSQWQSLTARVRGSLTFISALFNSRIPCKRVVILKHNINSQTFWPLSTSREILTDFLHFQAQNFRWVNNERNVSMFILFFFAWVCRLVCMTYSKLFLCCIAMLLLLYCFYIMIEPGFIKCSSRYYRRKNFFYNWSDRSGASWACRFHTIAASETVHRRDGLGLIIRKIIPIITDFKLQGPVPQNLG